MINGDLSNLVSTNISTNGGNVIVGSNTGNSFSLVYEPSGTVYSIYAKPNNVMPWDQVDISTLTKISADFIKP